MSYVDGSTQIKDLKMLFNLLDQFVQEEGAEHIAQVIMDNVANYVLAGKLLRHVSHHFLDSMHYPLH